MSPGSEVSLPILPSFSRYAIKASSRFVYIHGPYQIIGNIGSQNPSGMH